MICKKKENNNFHIPSIVSSPFSTNIRSSCGPSTFYHTQLTKDLPPTWPWTISNSILDPFCVMTQVHRHHFQLWNTSYKHHLCYNIPFHNLKPMQLKPTQKRKHKTTQKKHTTKFTMKKHITQLFGDDAMHLCPNQKGTRGLMTYHTLCSKAPYPP